MVTNTIDFDIFKFLDLDNLKDDIKEGLEGMIVDSMIEETVNYFVMNLSADDYRRFENEAKVIDSFDNWIELVAKYDPKFMEKIPLILAEFKNKFRLEDYLK